MKSITINSRIIYIIIAIVFIAYCYFSYLVFTASNSGALINGDSTDANGNITSTKTLSEFFSNIGILNVITPVIVLLLIILIFFDSS